MKKFFIVIMGLIASIQAFSQISYQQSDYASVGESFVVSTANVNLGGLDFAQTGTSFSWDFSTVVPTTQETITYLDPDNAGYQTSWIANCIFNTGGIFTCPGAWNDLTNLALENDNSTSFLNLLPIGIQDVVTHFDKDNGLLRETMLGISVGSGGINLPFPIDYDIPDTILRFPLNYQDVDSSERAFSIDLNGFGVDFLYSSSQQRINTVEGWGSLITPFDTFPSTLKMRTVIRHNDSTTIGGNTLPANVTTEVIYSWFEQNTGIPVFVASGLIVANNEIITSVDFVDSVRCFTPDATFLTNPLLIIVDPVSGTAEVNFANLSQNADSYKWYFGDGDSSIQVNPSHTYSGGIYTASLIACNTVCSPPECDTFSLPVVVIDSSAVVATWTSNPDPPCIGDSVNFNNFSFNADSYHWDFGDGDTSTLQAPIHAFQASGNYTVRLIASSGTQVDTSERIISVNDFPIAFAGNDTAIAPGTSVQLQANGGGAGANFRWNFSTDLSCIFCDSPVASPGETSTYIVNVRNSCGTDTDTITVVVDSTISNLEANQVFLNQWKIYPNPFKDKLMIASEKAIQHVEASLYSVRGELLRIEELTSLSTEWNLVDLPAGVYFLKLTAENGESGFKKIVKNF